MPSFFENRSPNSHRPVHQTQTNTANTNNNSKDRVTQPKGTQRLLMDANDKAVSSTSRSEGVASKGPAKREGEANNNNPNNNGAKKSIFDRLVKKGNNPSSVGPSLGVRPRDRSLQAESGAGDLVTKRLRVDQVGKSIITNTQNTITRPKPAIASLRAPPHAAPQRPPRPAMPPNAMHAPIPAAPKDEENKGGELAFGGHGDAGQGDDPNAKYKKKRCRDWPGCQKPDCAFHHPKDPCPYFPKCSFGDRCLYIHPQVEIRSNLGNTQSNVNHRLNAVSEWVARDRTARTLIHTFLLNTCMLSILVATPLSIAIDLKSPENLERCKRLLATQERTQELADQVLKVAARSEEATKSSGHRRALLLLLGYYKSLSQKH
eukprot:TRINITY_DN6126_c0_g1_i4.p1 TRINITY_DN6126_c0_g1~~TRINITY_DN6126_c0_g1_i4.p1  ORF type:complete len:375 (-),score=34.53 TRINITY_DN6126_c0_g1_i4:252-1376(-)